MLDPSPSSSRFARADTGTSAELGTPFAQAVTLRIRFEVPVSLRRGSRFHTRRFEGVPLSVARTIVADAVAYAKRPDDRSRQALYRYRSPGSPQPGQEPEEEEGGSAVSLPLDFEEVASLALTAPAGLLRDESRDGAQQ